MPKPIGKVILTKGGIEAYKNAAVKSASIKPKYFKFSNKEYNLDDAFNFTDSDIKGWWIKEDITAYLPIDDNTIEYLCEVKPDKAEKFCALCGIYLEDGTLIALAKPPYSFPPNVAQRFKVQVTYGNLNKLTDFKYIPFEEIKRDLSKFDAQISLSDQIIKLSDEIEKIKDNIRVTHQRLDIATAPDFDSGWFPISSQAGTDSYKEISHDLGSIPKFWTAYAKADTSKSDNSGLTDTVFVVGVAHTRDDDQDAANYGGLVAGATDKLFRIWVPDKSNNGANGRVISIYDGWGGEVNATQIKHALVKILAWK
jgi:hypothetical protein